MDLNNARWRKARASGSNGGGCVEVAHLGTTGVGVRDSKRPEGGAIVVSAAQWATFVGTIKDGKFTIS